MTITENCPDEDKEILVNWNFTSEANITLPLSCSINSTKINRGAVRLHSSEAKTIVLKEKRMQILRRTHTEEIKATINQTDFVKNPLTAENLTIHNIWGRSVGGFTFYNWVIIGSAAAIALLLGSAVMCKICARIQDSSGVKVQNNIHNKMENNFPLLTQNTSPTCPLPTMAKRGTNPLDRKPPAYDDEKPLEIQRINREKREWLEKLH